MDIAKACAGDKANLGTLSLKESIGCYGSVPCKTGSTGVAERDARPSWIARLGSSGVEGTLKRPPLTVVKKYDKVGEGTATIDCDALYVLAHASLSAWLSTQVCLDRGSGGRLR